MTEESDIIEVPRSDPSVEEEPPGNNDWAELDETEQSQLVNLPIKWSPQMEIALFQAMGKNKPVGIHKHFRMANIVRLYNSNSPVKCSSQDIWDYLSDLFHLPSLDETEDQSDSEWGLPLKHPFRKCDFYLPPYDFEEVVKENHPLTQFYNSLRESSPSLSIPTSTASTPEPEAPPKKATRTRRTTDGEPKTTIAKRGRGRGTPISSVKRKGNKR
ncbi:hypothetical protein K7432_011080 [Basidiobolus ranarum]|uniref:MRG-binding protein n=1 Tax=Basidiobolus ranarum TaxID=34480 RepID=A0ABR2VUK8_9FUNG